jgi:trk system potassium uptake protein TrkA
MSKQILIIGLGQFGSSLARALAQQGGEVMAVDINKARIADLADVVSDAMVMDATDEEALAALAPAQRDTCVCAIGDESRENSIVVTALLKQLGAPRVIARATNDLHARILSLVGAHEVINPERDYGERLAMRLAWRNVVNVLPLGDGLVITEIEAPESFWGRSLAELQLPRRFSVTVAATREGSATGERTALPDPQRPLKRGDILLLVGTQDHLQLLTKRI